MILMQNLPIPTTSSNSNLKDSLNLQAVTVWTNQQKFIIQPNYQKSGIPTCLHIQRTKGQVFQLQQKNDVSQYQPHYFSAFLGILNLSNKKIIVLVEKVCLVMSIGQRDVFKIIKPVYLFYNTQQKKNLSEEQSMILMNLTMILEQGMYFSYSYNLDEPLNTVNANQKQQILDAQKLVFNWASQLQKQIINCNRMWKIPLIQGYVDKIQMIINGLKIFVFLISRRSTSRSGTLYSVFGRGVDRNGYTANFVQTQLIVNVNQYFFSYLQTRGSVPIYWRQQLSYGGMNKIIKFMHSIQENSSAFRKHLKLVKNRNDFQHIGIINLLNQQSSFQKGLILNYQYLVMKNVDQQLFKSQVKDYSKNEQKQPKTSLPYLKCNDIYMPKNVNYAYFNIHSQCSKKQYKPLLQFIQTQLRKLLHKYQFTVLKIDQNSKKKQILNTQKGVFRVNCMNCIDRSNITQLSIGAYMIPFMLKHIGIQIPQFQNGIQFILKDDSFSNLYRQMWADNADALSKQYTGTGSTQSFALRKGKLSYLTTIDHGMKSLTRAIKNIRNPDELKNKTIKILTGYKQPGLFDSDTDIAELKQIQYGTNEKAKQIKNLKTEQAKSNASKQKNYQKNKQQLQNDKNRIQQKQLISQNQ